VLGAVVFDVGGVLLDWDPRHLYRKLGLILAWSERGEPARSRLGLPAS
jgi:hypothetical protein